MPVPVAQPVTFPSLDDMPAAPGGSDISLLLDVPLQVTVELGRTQLRIRNVLELVPGSIVELDKLAGEPVDVLVNGKQIARGEVVVIDEEFGVRITDVASQAKRLRGLAAEGVTHPPGSSPRARFRYPQQSRRRSPNAPPTPAPAPPAHPRHGHLPPTRHGSPSTRRRTRPSPPRTTAAGWSLTLAVALTASPSRRSPPWRQTTTTPVDPETLPIPEGSATPTTLSGGAGGTLLRLGVGLIVVVGLIAAVWFVMKRVQRAQLPGAGGERARADRRRHHHRARPEPRAAPGARGGGARPGRRHRPQRHGLARIGVEDARRAWSTSLPPGPGFGRRRRPRRPGVDDRARAVATADDAIAGRAPARPDHAALMVPLRPARAVPEPLPTLRERIVAAMPPPAPTRRRRWLRRGFLLFAGRHGARVHRSGPPSPRRPPAST